MGGGDDVLYPYVIGEKYIHIIDECVTYTKIPIPFPITKDNLCRIFEYVC
jgi:hypothetical protein